MSNSFRHARVLSVVCIAYAGGCAPPTEQRDSGVSIDARADGAATDVAPSDVGQGGDSMPATDASDAAVTDASRDSAVMIVDRCPGRPLGVAVNTSQRSGPFYSADMMLGADPEFNAGPATHLSFGMEPGMVDDEIQLLRVVVPANVTTRGGGMSTLNIVEFPAYCQANYFLSASQARCDLALGPDNGTDPRTATTNGVFVTTGSNLVIPVSINDPARAAMNPRNAIHLSTGVWYFNLVVSPRLCMSGTPTRVLFEWMGVPVPM